MIRIILFISFLLSSFNLFGTIIGKKHPFFVQNGKRTHKYYILQQNESIKYKSVSSDDEITLYVRAVISKDPGASYYFKIIAGNGEKTYKRKLRPSKKSRGVNNLMVSKLSKVKLNSDYFKLKNISDFPIIVRIKSHRKFFIEYSPKNYESIQKISVKNKTYTYYQSKNDIELTFDGDIYLKIISRKLVDSSQSAYSYSVYDNGNIIKKRDVVARASGKANLLPSKDKVSKGDVLIIKFDKGKHKITIASDKNIYFKFYINKKAVRMIK